MGSHKKKKDTKRDRTAEKKAAAARKAEKEKQTSKAKRERPDPKEAKPTASKKRPAPAAEPQPPPLPQPDSSELERKRLQVAEELRKVEQQIFDLETKYLDQSSSAFGNAVRGYEGFLGGLSQANRKLVTKPEERLFSMSSATGASVPTT